MCSKATLAQTIDVSSFKAILADLAGMHVYSGIPQSVQPSRYAAIFCSLPKSTVRFLPFKNLWQLADFTPFEGEDFAYAVTCSLLHRDPSKSEIALVSSSIRPVEKMRLLMEVHQVIRHNRSGVRLHGLFLGKVIYRLMRTAERYRLRFLAKQAGSLLKRYASRQFAHLEFVTAQQRRLYECLDRLDGLEEKLTCGPK